MYLHIEYIAIQSSIIHSILTYCKKRFTQSADPLESKSIEPVPRTRSYTHTYIFLLRLMAHSVWQPLKHMLKTFKPFIKRHSKGIPRTNKLKFMLNRDKIKPRPFSFDFYYLLFIFHNLIKFFLLIREYKFVF